MSTPTGDQHITDLLAVCPWDDRWHALVPAPRDRDVRPRRVTAVGGQVSGCPDIVTGAGPLVLRCATADQPARAVVDFGVEVSGYPWFSFADSGRPGQAMLRAGYSESLRYLRPDGDLTVPEPRVAGNPGRVERYPVRGPGLVRQRFLQGGFRYQLLSVETPGDEVTIDALGVWYTPYLGTPDTYQGHFLCSDELLNKIWYAGVHTLHLNMVEPGEQAGYWAVLEGALDVRDTWTDYNASPIGLLRTGEHWTDVDIRFHARVESGRLNWVVRGRSPGTGLLLGVSTHAGCSWLAVEIQSDVDVDACRELTRVRLPEQLAPGQWHEVHTLVSGTRLTVSIAGGQPVTVDLAVVELSPTERDLVAAGTVGFCARPGDAAAFRSLTVSQPGPPATELVNMPLSAPEELAAFDPPGTVRLPLITDGQKRDRLVWQGDNMVAGRTLLVSSEAIAHVRESLRLLGSHQLASGYVPANANPAAVPRTRLPARTSETVRYPSASYSLYTVLNLHDYWWHTADLGFVAECWPMICAELAWNESRTGPDGLLRTDERDGMGWRYALVRGTPSYENVVYAHALRCAAELADELGQHALASQWTDQAEGVTTALDALLFDPDSGLYELSAEQRGHTVLDANASAVHYGLLSGDRGDRALDALLSRLDSPHGTRSISEPVPPGQFPTIGPMMNGVLVWALADQGRTTEALRLIRSGWGPMVTGDPGMTVWEVLWRDGGLVTPGINHGGGGNTSLAHPWASGPTFALSRYVLGVRALAPGYQRWLVCPQFGDLSWARGAVPTPHGPIRVRWARETGRLAVEVESPPGTTGAVSLGPIEPGTVARWNGEVVFPEPAGRSLRLSVTGPGVHRFELA